MRQRVNDALASLDAVSTEFGGGFPDVNHALGWIELKQISDWPVNAATPVAVAKFYQDQRVWIRKRCRCALGIVHLILHVSRPDDWILLPGRWAADHLGRGATKDHVLANSIKSWERGLDPADLCETIKRTPT
jgi:hypothetical protein